MALPADLLIPADGAGNRRDGELPWLALCLAALLHGLVLLSLIVDWRLPVAAPKKLEPIPVSIVFVPPPAPTPPPPPPPPAATPAPTPPPPPPANFAARESGPDQRTRAPPPGETPSPEKASPKAAEPAPETPPKENPAAAAPLPEAPTPPPEKPKPAPRKDAVHAEPEPKEAETLRAPHPAPSHRLNVEPGERAESGDPYLNRLRDMLERHRVYPRVLGQFGLPVEGTAVYGVLLDRSGGVRAIKVERSSGASGIDEAGEGMIRKAAPFPPLPADYPEGLVLTVTIHLFPPQS